MNPRARLMISCYIFNSQTVVKVKKLILDGPDSTKVESEVQMYLLALKNSMLPEAIPIFIKYAESEVGAYSTIALTALQRYDVSLMTDEVSHTLYKTLFELMFMSVNCYAISIIKTEKKKHSSHL